MMEGDTCENWEDCVDEDYYDDDYYDDDYYYDYDNETYADEEYYECYEDATCEFVECEDHEYMDDDMDCWKELCFDCNYEMESCYLWFYDYDY
jgi:hypothetical protein